MKKMIKKLSIVTMLLVLVGFVFTGCDNNDEDPEPPNDPTGKSETYTLFEAGSSGASGTIKFEELLDMSTRITISLTGAGGDHPAHIHDNSAAEGGGIAIDLTIVDASGKSITEVSALNNGTKITYNELIDFNGYVNVHKSASELGSLIAQGDIGMNALTGNAMEFELFEAKVAGVSGKVTFNERKNGETLVVIELSGTSAGGDHPAHVHANTVAEGGGIMVSLNNVDGATGVSQTNVSKLNDDTPVSYSELKDFNGYVQVHNSESDLGTPIALGDIGMNELTGKSEMYPLNAKSNPEISGSAKFEERKSGATLVSLMLNGTSMGDSHPAHIHMNTAAEGGGIAISLTSVDGGTGISYTNVSQKNDETAITYDDLIEFNGYINVHNSSMDLGTLIAQGDIGQNALTGTTMSYTLNEQNASGVSGTATFAERNNGFTLITISLIGTMEGGDHPAHIHNGDVANPGGIAISLNNVNGAS
ncbi:MAG: CHRD domain-containing protein, partial [Cyclobacteriaceae bacterium]|nr:CHRD domain-containing protein [Cyclobacteriaceae bacterium]